MSEAMIQVEGLWKRYGLPLKPMLNRFVARLRGRPYDELKAERWSLREVNFSLRRGETLGIIGRNGAGKSTLLKVLAGVTPPTKGRVAVHGSIFPMIELNAGIHTELTGRENVYLLGAIMGFTRGQIRQRMDKIEEFCELGEWFDLPAWKYSSGMLARLGFGVAMNVDADILLVDEVLAVGDLAFQRKCYARIQELNNSGSTILLVSHNIRQIERLCDQAILMEGGRIQAQGSAERIAEMYYTRADEESRQKLEEANVSAMSFESSGDLYIDKIEVQDLSGHPVEQIETGEGIRLVFHIRALKPIEQPALSFGLVSTDMIVIASVSNVNQADRPSFAGISQYVCTIPRLPLNPGVYAIRTKVIDQSAATIFRGHNMATLQVIRPLEEHDQKVFYSGFLRLDAEW
jgi:lipopolysaccharide transport system ATP-binding protein